MRRVAIAVVLMVAGHLSPSALPLRADLELPVGIPMPPFGVRESVESQYGDANHSTHWVDNTSRSCSDASPTGTRERPRCSLPRMDGLEPGAVVQLRGGPYTLASTLVIRGSGTAAKPIVIRGSPAGGTTIQAGPGRQTVVARSSYVIVEHLTFTDRDEAFVINGSDHVAVRDCLFVGTGTAVDGAGSVINAAGSSYIVRLRNTIRDAGNWQSMRENDMHGLGVGHAQHDIWDLYNTVYHIGGDAVGNGHGAGQTTYNLYIGGNTFYETRENAVDLKEVHDVVISSNVAYGFAEAPGDGSSRGEAIVLHYGPRRGQGPYNVWVLNNLIHDSVIGIAGSGVGAGQYWIGNVFYRCGAAMLVNATSGGEYSVFHNTLVDNGTGQWWGVNTDALTVGGNIVASDRGGAHLRVDTSAQRARAVFKNELYYQPRGQIVIGWSHPLTSVSAWVRLAGTGAGSQQSDPLFVDEAARDYRLKPGSPAIGRGIDMTATAALFARSFRASLLRDRAGTPRPNGVWDVGAYQSTAGRGTPPPRRAGRATVASGSR